MEPILRMERIDKRFAAFYALKGVSFNVYPGKVNVLIGENGAGKSTLMKILSGVYRKDGGQIYLDGKPIEIRNPIDAEHYGIGTVYQELMLAPDLSIAENIFLGADLRTNALGKVKWKEIYAEAARLTRELVGLDVDPHMKVRHLGIAYQQMIEVARVLRRNIRILVMDEPTAALTQKEIKKLFETIRALTARGIAIVYISHRLEEIFEIGDNICVLRDGELVGHLDAKVATQDELIRMMVGRELGDKFPKEDFSGIESREMLRVEGLTRKGVFEDISFSVRRGEILGFAGLMGAGRTEIARAIFGADGLDAGRIFIEGREVAVRSVRDAIANGVALLPEDRKKQGLVLKRSVAENITLANLRAASLRFGVLDKRAESREADHFIKMLRISVPGKQSRADTLSGGNQQKVVIAKWVYADSKILILDEPTRGIDVGAKTEVYALINSFVRAGKAVIVISSELPELLGVCTRILAIREGRIAGAFDSTANQEEVLTAMIGGSKT